MFCGAIDVGSMIAFNRNRLDGTDVRKSAEKISTGLRINYAADNPSGLAIGGGMTAQLRGVSTAIHNLEEGVWLLRTADSVLGEVHEILLRQRDIALTGANEAVQYTVTTANPNDVVSSSERVLFNELIELDMEIYRMVRAQKFNTKQVLFGYEFGQDLQVGPDNVSNHRIVVIIPDLSSMGRAVPVALPGTITHAQFVAAFQNAIDSISTDVATISDARAKIGAQENVITHVIDDLNLQRVNISSSISGIMDVDMASELVEFTKTQFLGRTSEFAVRMTDYERKAVATMLNAAGMIR